jgi:hypothetical protein
MVSLAWFGDNFLNLWAQLALRSVGTIRAKEMVEGLAARYPSIRSIEEARRVVQRMASRGTCLSRSLVVATRCPGSAVIIGVAKGRSAASSDAPVAPFAHAWVEINGVPVDDDPRRSWTEIGRLDIAVRTVGEKLNEVCDL